MTLGRALVIVFLAATGCAHETPDRASTASAPAPPSAVASKPAPPSVALPTNLPLFASATCDTVAHAIAFPRTTHVTIVPDTVNLPDVPQPETWPRRGCLVALDDTVASSGDAPNVEYEDWFRARGWAYGPWYGADGPDGTSFGFLLKDRFCLVKGRWDGGDDSDSTVVPAPGFKLTLFCGPGIPADTMR